MMAGRITDPATVASMAKRLSMEGATSEPLLPIYDANGSVVAFERAVDVIQTTRMEYGTNLAEQIGVWRGRQVEEKKAELVNQELIGKMYDMYRADAKISKDNNKMYVNLLAHTKDPVVLDAIRLFTKETIEHAESLFGADTFMVRKDMLNDAIGYRSATIGDAWTGNTRWSKETQAVVKNLATSVFGNKAYMYLTNTERAVQGFMAGARTAIVVKSVVVPITNFVSNILQLISRGVPITTITKLMPTKLAEIEAYTKSKLRQIELEAELRAATTNSVAERKLRVEIRSITDSHKRMSIWTLIEAGEFSTIADVGMTHEEVDLASGNLAKYIEAKVDKLPKGLRTFGKYGLVTKDTALFQGLQK
jgi:ethanolamine utilization protein EutP (predicted NTPase)